eukprot:Nk52_evm42s1671 gene=Nk52_evmTU42s1671
MKDYQQRLIELSIEKQVLCFGSFTLKSGRQSPYFFNAGLFNTGNTLWELAKAYAGAIVDSGIEFDVLFGPAYKGISLAAATSCALAEKYGKDVPYCYNRKEAKDHGEGGNLVGAKLEGRVLIIDDVITAGTAIRQAMVMISSSGAKTVGVITALDRQEKGKGEISTIQELKQEYDISVLSIINLTQLIEYLSSLGGKDELIEGMKSYQSQYCSIQN